MFSGHFLKQCDDSNHQLHQREFARKDKDTLFLTICLEPHINSHQCFESYVGQHPILLGQWKESNRDINVSTLRRQAYKPVVSWGQNWCLHVLVLLVFLFVEQEFKLMLLSTAWYLKLLFTRLTIRILLCINNLVRDHPHC